jgi:hypothetical protein
LRIRKEQEKLLYATARNLQHGAHSIMTTLCNIKNWRI